MVRLAPAEGAWSRAKVMPLLPNPVQEPQELGTGPSHNNTANLPPPASTSAEAHVTPADRVMYDNLLVEPLTVDHIRNVTQLDEKRQQLLEEAQDIAEQGAKLDRDLVNAQKSIEKARAMEAEYKTLLQQQNTKKAPARVINDPGVQRNLGWAPPKPAQAKPYIDSEGKQVMLTPLLNLVVAKTLLEQDRSPEAVEQVYDLVDKVVKQQEKATSQRLESDPALCQSSQCKPPRDRSPLDVGSQTGSSERRQRDARNRKDAIPISSDHGETARPRRPSPPPRSPRHREDY